MNNWDLELTQYKLHSESSCTIFKSCDIKWSPEIGLWLSQRWLLARVRRFVLGQGPPDPCNLIQDCLCSHLFDPRLISHSKIMIHIHITQHQLSRLAKDAPTLCQKHLLDLQKAADVKRGFGLLCYNTRNINPWAREKEMATTQPHYLPAKRRSPNHAASTSRANRQHLLNGEQDVRTYLQTPISTIPPRSLSSMLPRTIVWWPWVYGRYQMRTKDPRRNVRISTRYQWMDKEDIATSPNDVLTNVRNWNCINDHNGRLLELLATGGWKNFVIFQWHQVF